MKAIKHSVKHYYQPTNDTCGYGALATLLSFYGKSLSPEELIKAVPQPVNDRGQTTGSITSQLVTWVQLQGLKTHMYTSDAYIVDHSWRNLSQQQIKQKLKTIRSTRNVPAIGKEHTTLYIDAYLQMLESGSRLTVVNFITVDLLYRLLRQSPVYANISSTVLAGKGRMRSAGLRKSVADDIGGNVSNHSIVIYGNDTDGNFLVSDPWDGLVTIKPELPVLAIQAAEMQCDNQCFVIED